MLRFILLLGLIILSSAAFSQKKNNEADSLLTSKAPVIRKGGRIISKEFYKKRFQPRKSILYSAIFPGLGQIYNKKYWKFPIVYGGFALVLYVVDRYNKLYIKNKGLLIDKINNTPNNSTLTVEQLRGLTDKYRRERDYFLIFTGLWYFVQLLDAHVDSHLKEFDLNPKLKLTIAPYQEQNSFAGNINGLSLNLKF